MSDRGAFERTLGSLHDAMLDDSHWPATSALIDEVCGLMGNTLAVGGRTERRYPGELLRTLLPR